MTSAEETALVRGASALGVHLDAASIDRIGRFIDRLDIWNRRSHLTGDRDRSVLVRKHAVDSLAVVSELPASGTVIDIGSGAGFPGLVIGCSRPELALVLIESRRKPASFLSDALRSIPLPEARVLQIRAEDAARDELLAGGVAAVVLPTPPPLFATAITRPTRHLPPSSLSTTQAFPGKPLDAQGRTKITRRRRSPPGNR